MTVSDPNPKREAALRIIETSRLLRNLVEQRLKPHGMTRAQFATLSRLEAQPRISQAELAELLEIQPIAMVRVIDQLSADGLVERRQDPQDRRCNRLTITAAGLEKLHSLVPLKEELGAELFEGISDEELSRLLRTLQTIHQNIKKTINGGAEAVPASAAKVSVP